MPLCAQPRAERKLIEEFRRVCLGGSPERVGKNFRNIAVQSSPDLILNYLAFPGFLLHSLRRLISSFPPFQKNFFPLTFASFPLSPSGLASRRPACLPAFPPSWIPSFPLHVRFSFFFLSFFSSQLQDFKTPFLRASFPLFIYTILHPSTLPCSFLL